MPRKYIILFLIYLIICAVLILLYGHFMVYVGVGLSFLMVLRLSIEYYNEHVRLPKVQRLRREKIFEYLSGIYGHGIEIKGGYYEFQFNQRTIAFHYYTSYHRTFRNHLTLYQDISHLDPYLQKLCRIHFYCDHFDGRTWVSKGVDHFFNNSTKALSRQSIKTVKRLIEEVDQYVEEKTAQ